MLSQFIKLWNEQVNLVRVHGFKMVLRKIYTIFLLPLAGTGAVFIYFLKPLVIVRVGDISLDRIGGGYNALWYLSELRAGKFDKKYFDLFYHPPGTKVCNKQWFAMLKRKIKFFGWNKLAHIVFKLFHMFNMNEHIISYSLPPANETLRIIFSNHDPLIQFTEDEEQKGQQLLERIGIKKGSHFICFHSRDAAYLNVTFNGVNWGYHDYRNTSVDNYLKAVEKITESGCYAVRMGAVVDQKINTKNPNIIDYASSPMRSDFLDIYLSAKCKYFLGSDCGITIMAEAFMRPLIYANWVSIRMLSTFYHNGLVIMKKWYSRKNGRLLTFSEILEIAKPHQINLENLDVELIDNSAQEIIDAADEMEKRMEGSFVPTMKDEELQDKFWDLYGRQWLRAPAFCIGAKFLRDNQGLFNDPKKSLGEVFA